jgi:putative peptidoglycan lipid II flippase
MTEKNHHLARSAGIFTGATLLSRILGYIRDTMVAAYFGAGPAADAFYTAFRMSNLFRRLLGEGALSASFVPVFSEYTQKKTKEETQRFLNTMFTTLFAVLATMTLAGILFAPELTRLMARGFEPGSERFELTVTLTRYMFPFILFICLAALLTGVLNAFRSFFLPALAPASLSVAEILFISGLWVFHLNHHDAIVGLAMSVTVGGMLQFLIHLPALKAKEYSLGFEWNPHHEGVTRVGKLILPATIGVAADQINAFVDTMMATFLSVGSVTALYYSNRVMQLPLALFGIALSQVALPSMSASVARGNMKEVKETLNFSIRLTLFMILPAMTGLLVLGERIVSALFEYGKFSHEATILTAWALAGFALGLVAYAVVKILAAAFYAQQTTRTPVIVASACVALNIAINLAFLFARPQLATAYPEWASAINGKFGVATLALATTISSWANAIALFILLRRRMGLLGGRRMLVTVLKSSLACVVMAGFIWAVPYQAMPKILALAVGISGGAAIYLMTAKLIRMEEWPTFISMFLRRPAAPPPADA